MLLQLGLQLVLPSFLVVSLWRTVAKSRREWLLSFLATLAAYLIVFLIARWDFTSYYLRYVFVAILLVAGYRSFFNVSNVQTENRTPELTSAAFLVMCCAACVWLMGGFRCPEGAIALSFPLRGGFYYVGGGGNNRFINNHQAHEPQKFALDIVRLTALGNRASRPLPRELEHFAIYGDTVYSPCSGTVIQAVDRIPDLRPPDKDTTHLAGNHIVIAFDDCKVILAHLKRGSVTVEVGAEVNPGDVLGQVGNSGNTSQPHLHLHVERGGHPTKILFGTGVPFTLGGRFLVRNGLFTGS